MQGVRITCNLWDALGLIIKQHHCLSAGLYWIDAICIIQASGEERNHQVCQMWRIYSSAREVFAWLGAEDVSTKEAFNAIAQVEKSCRSGNIHCSGWKMDHTLPGASILKHITELLNRPYFGRTCVIQEFVQARRLWIICGTQYCSGDSLLHLQKSVRRSPSW